MPVGHSIVGLIYRTLSDNYACGSPAAHRKASSENWRWPRPQTQIATDNRSPEVMLERAIAAVAHRAGSVAWANQVPVASGLVGKNADRRRAIDLVHRCAPHRFEFIELKIHSDTPFYAAIEIIGYGCLWLLTRANLATRPSAILEATHVDLKVLAPSPYYASYELSGLEGARDQGCRTLGETQCVTVTFAFEALDRRLMGPVSMDDAALLATLDGRTSWRTPPAEATT
jgi:hypothetical protein